jgi:hypothetical protein
MPKTNAARNARSAVGPGAVGRTSLTKAMLASSRMVEPVAAKAAQANDLFQGVIVVLYQKDMVRFS